jgi:hypothetical protein
VSHVLVNPSQNRQAVSVKVTRRFGWAKTLHQNRSNSDFDSRFGGIHAKIANKIVIYQILICLFNLKD